MYPFPVLNYILLPESLDTYFRDITWDLGEPAFVIPVIKSPISSTFETGCRAVMAALAMTQGAQ